MTMPQRLLHVLGSISPAYGGPSTAAEALISGLQAFGIECDVMTTTLDKTTTNFSQVSTLIIKRGRLLLRNKFGTLHSTSLIISALRKAPGYDFVHIHLARDLLTLPLALLLRAMHVPYVLQTHGTCLPWRGWKRSIDTIALRPALRGAKWIFALTDEEAAYLGCLTGGSATISVLENAVVPPPDLLVRRETGSDTVLFVARLHPRKRVLVFADMARTLFEVLPNLRYQVIGSDEGEAASLNRFVREAGLEEVFTYSGPMPAEEVRKAMSAAFVLVHPAEREPFGMVIIEALAHGLPVILNDGAQLAKRLVDAGACLAVPADAGLMAQAVLRLNSNPPTQERMRDAGIRVVKQWFTPAAVALELLTKLQYTPSAKG
jgi:glycosyltransferase involved in cell wall biosynthesis